MDIKQLATELDNLSGKFSEAKEKIATLESEKAALLTQPRRAEAMESNLIKSFGVNHVKDLLTVNVAHPRYAAVDQGHKLAAIELKKDMDIARFCAQMFYGEPMDRDDGASQVKGILETGYAKQVDLVGRLKAFGTDVSGAGAEWIPTAISSQYLDEYQLAREVQKLFREMPMPTNPYRLPVKTNSTVARKATEGAAGTGANFGTSYIDFDANKLYEYYPITEELNEDSAPSVLEMGRMEVVESQIRAMETMILNGDSTATHMDSDVTASDDARKIRKGLRKLALANSANGSVVGFGSAVTKEKLLDLKSAMGKYGVNPRELAWILSSTVYNQVLALPEVMTVDKIGTQATILQGALAAILGIPLVVSEYMREDLNASGVYDGVTTNNSSLLLVNHRQFMVGMRRPIRVKVAMDARPEYDRWQLVSYQRADFAGRAQGANEVSVAIGVDVSV
jgi:HK97 family phage major capsid protein